MRLARHASCLEEFWVCGEQSEDGQGRSGVATAADTVVISELGKRLSRNDLRYHNWCP